MGLHNQNLVWWFCWAVQSSPIGSWVFTRICHWLWRDICSSCEDDLYSHSYYCCFGL